MNRIKKLISVFSIILMGSVFIILGFLIVGPVNWIPLATSINYKVIGLILHGLSIGALLVSSFSDALGTGLFNNILFSLKPITKECPLSYKNWNCKFPFSNRQNFPFQNAIQYFPSYKIRVTYPCFQFLGFEF